MLTCLLSSLLHSLFYDQNLLCIMYGLTFIKAEPSYLFFHYMRQM
jgi:hypothetical protein